MLIELFLFFNQCMIDKTFLRMLIEKLSLPIIEITWTMKIQRGSNQNKHVSIDVTSWTYSWG